MSTEDNQILKEPSSGACPPYLCPLDKLVILKSSPVPMPGLRKFNDFSQTVVSWSFRQQDENYSFHQIPKLVKGLPSRVSSAPFFCPCKSNKLLQLQMRREVWLSIGTQGLLKLNGTMCYDTLEDANYFRQWSF